MSDIPSMSEDRLERWKQRWEVIDPDIRCLACGGRQPLHIWYDVFNRYHAPGCRIQSDLPQRPKHDLMQILQALSEELRSTQNLDR